jgi:hypothetical protein
VTFEICGLEEIVTTQTTSLSYFYNRTATAVIEKPILVKSLFLVNSTNCLIQAYRLTTFSQITGHVARNELDAKIGAQFSIEIDTSVPSLSTFYIEASRAGGKKAYVKVDLEVCGTDILKVINLKNDNFLMMKQQNAKETIYTFIDLFNSTSQRCAIFFYLEM